MKLRENIGFLRRFAILFGSGMLAAGALSCSSVPVKMECQEIRTRIDLEGLSGDQLRFALGELRECEHRLKSAERKDSAWADSAEGFFTPTSPDSI